jgi:3-dehydroquinate synthase
VVTDLGGFAAATFNRGIKYINIPTSMIGQVDAAVGGKTGINLEHVKNQAGLFYDPSAVFIQHTFLETLPENHFKSGFAEMIKSALLSGNELWGKIKNSGFKVHDQVVDLIYETVRYKCTLVKIDPFDNSVRKVLNFGHTVGHALEALYNSPGRAGMLHGEAVAAGMICEAYIANRTAGLSGTELGEITHVLLQYFDFKAIEERDFEDLLVKMLFDKKRSSDNISFSLLEGIGKPCFDIEVSQDAIITSFHFYNQLMQDDQDNKK